VVAVEGEEKERKKKNREHKIGARTGRMVKKEPREKYQRAGYTKKLLGKWNKRRKKMTQREEERKQTGLERRKKKKRKKK